MTAIRYLLFWVLLIAILSLGVLWGFSGAEYLS
jgi:hypothetical protein